MSYRVSRDSQLRSSCIRPECRRADNIPCSTGPDGPRTLCKTCSANYSNMELVLYQEPKTGKLSAVRRDGWDPMRVIGFRCKWYKSSNKKGQLSGPRYSPRDLSQPVVVPISRVQTKLKKGLEYSKTIVLERCLEVIRKEPKDQSTSAWNVGPVSNSGLRRQQQVRRRPHTLNLDEIQTADALQLGKRTNNLETMSIQPKGMVSRPRMSAAHQRRHPVVTFQPIPRTRPRILSAPLGVNQESEQFSVSQHVSRISNLEQHVRTEPSSITPSKGNENTSQQLPHSFSRSKNQAHDAGNQSRKELWKQALTGPPDSELHEALRCFSLSLENVKVGEICSQQLNLTQSTNEIRSSLNAPSNQKKVVRFSSGIAANPKRDNRDVRNLFYDLKVHFEGTVRRIRLQLFLSYGEFINSIRKFCQIPDKVSISYEDDDKDMVVISTSMDLWAMYELLRERRMKVARITIVPNPEQNKTSVVVID